jgi:hypothetical protein
MAAVASTDVTRISNYESGDRFGRRIEDIKIFDVVLTANGATANDIPASLFGFRTLNWVQCIRALDDAGTPLLANLVPVVETDGEGFLVCNPETSTDADRGHPANYTGTIRVRMGGV